VPRRVPPKGKTLLFQLTEALLRGDETAAQRLANALDVRRPQMGRGGKAGATGTGRRRKIGKSGKKRPKRLRAPLDEAEALDIIVMRFDDVDRRLNQHTRLIATIRRQVNGLIATVGRTPGGGLS
jgi:hypothetical protein